MANINLICSLCKNNNNLFKLKNCPHAFCRQYLYQYIQENFNCKIKCPTPGCQRGISDPNIRYFLSESDIERYEGLSLEKNYQKCLSKGCNYLYAVVGDNELIFQCPECEQPNCIKCNKRHFSRECGKSNLKSESDRDEEAKQELQRKRKEKCHKYDEKYELLPSHVGFECPICLEFILPSEAVMFRCGCNHCKLCLKETYKSMEYSNQLKCHNCKEEFSENEKVTIRSMDDVRKMSARIISQMLNKCQAPDCEGFWHTDKLSGFIKCPRCKKSNCLSCKDVHEEMECSEYRKTKKYIVMESMMKTAESAAQTKCYQCKSLLIHGGGCAAMPCKICNVHTCLFLGVKAGPDGCGCLPDNICHEDCKYGCIPE